jgi:putative flippase GtrA
MRSFGRVSRELRSFIAIGLACTAVYAVLYTVLRDGGLPSLAANALALLLTMGANFAANRRFTFAASDGPLVRQLGGYLVAYGIGLAASSAALALLLALLGNPRGALNTAAGLTAGIVATVVRFVLMRGWVFRARGVELEQAPAERAATIAA